MKIFLATPAFEGKVTVQFAISLAETRLLLAQNYIPIEMRITTSGSLLVAERNRLLEEFIKSDCTHILCIDSDLGWPPQAVKAMIDKDVDFVCGVYPARGDETAFIFRPEVHEDQSIVVSEKNLIKAQYVPAGFMLIKRNVIEKMRDHFPQLHFKPKNCPDTNPPEGYCLFNTEVWNGEFWGEDYIFCRNVRECGFDIWIDACIEFDHAGKRGMLARSLLSKNSEKSEEKL